MPGHVRKRPVRERGRSRGTPRLRLVVHRFRKGSAEVEVRTEQTATAPAEAPPAPRCALCGCKIFLGTGDDLARGRCRDCKNRPTSTPVPSNGNGHGRPHVAPALTVPTVARAFNAAE